MLKPLMILFRRGKCQSGSCDFGPQISVLRRIDPVQAGAQNGNGPALIPQAGEMGQAVDAQSKAGNNAYSGLRQARGYAPGHILAVGGAFSGTDYGYTREAKQAPVPDQIQVQGGIRYLTQGVRIVRVSVHDHSVLPAAHLLQLCTGGVPPLFLGENICY
jgi:hypothetical protein